MPAPSSTCHSTRASASSACTTPSNQSRPHSTAASRTITRACTCAARRHQQAGPVAGADVLGQRVADVALRAPRSSVSLWSNAVSVRPTPDVAARSRCAAAPGWPGCALTKSSMRSMQPSAWLRTGSGTCDLAAAGLQAGDHALQRVHRHPRAVRAALAGGAVAGGGRLDQRLARRQLAHAVHQPVVGGDDVGRARCRRRPRCSSCVVEPTTSACATTLSRRLGVHQHQRARVLAAQQLELEALELVVHDAVAVPQQHVGAGLLLDVAAQVAVGRPQDLLALRLAGAARWPARRSWSPSSRRAPSPPRWCWRRRRPGGRGGRRRRRRTRPAGSPGPASRWRPGRASAPACRATGSWRSRP